MGLQPVCRVSLYLREHVRHPKTKSTERIPWGIVGTYYGYYAAPFPLKGDVIEKALTVLLENFMGRAAARH